MHKYKNAGVLHEIKKKIIILGKIVRDKNLVHLIHFSSNFNIQYHRTQSKYLTPLIVNPK